MDERLVAVEQAVPAGEQVALEPALAQVLATAPPSPGRRARGGRRPASISAIHARSVTSKHGAEPVRRGLVRARRGGSRSALRRMTSRRQRAEHPGRLARRSRRAPARRPRSRGSRAARGRAAAAPPLACGLAPIRRVARRAPARASSARERAVARRTAPRAGSSASTPRAARRCSGLSREPGERHLVRAQRALDRHAVDLLRARSSPSACAARSSASAAARSTPPSRARALDRARSRRATVVERRGHLPGAPRLGVVALDEVRRVAVALEQRAQLVVAGCARAPSGWRSCSR